MISDLESYLPYGVVLTMDHDGHDVSGHVCHPMVFVTVNDSTAPGSVIYATTPFGTSSHHVTPLYTTVGVNQCMTCKVVDLIPYNQLTKTSV